ncbi:hypothetical protein BDQ17DRAFT_1418116 [Cyathus striatus]|nr:hypothetical protein BDQ17DRAFT_1418116 [Cyathus striatus]
MVLPEFSSLHLSGRNSSQLASRHPVSISEDILNNSNPDMEKLKSYAKSLPYSIEPYSKMVEMLDFILLRITQCIEAKDYDVGLLQWDSMLTYWSMLKYPIPKDKRVKLAKLYYLVSITPGMSTQMVATCADAFKVLTKSKKTISIEDMRLPWKPVYDILRDDLFLTRRQYEYTQLSWCMGYIADNSRRFFHPAAINEMLETFVPQIDGTKLDSILSSHYYLMTFLPLSHPQYYLPMLFRLWESINSYKYDERMLHFISKLVEMHVAPEVSDPRKIAQIPDDERSEGEGRPTWTSSVNGVAENGYWPGLFKDVGIFSDYEWEFLMCKCLASMEIPLADGGSLTTGPSADNQAGFEIGRLPKPQWRILSLSRIIVYSMAQDGIPVPPSNAPTPMFSPLPSGVNTPQIQTTSPGDYLSANLIKKAQHRPKAYLAGSRALDSLARLIASTESFFHPSNSGTWTSDLSAFIKYIVYDFNKRDYCIFNVIFDNNEIHIGWHEEQKPDCKTPKNRRLTNNVLSRFNNVGNIQACLKSMSVMEPDLILHPVLERAVPSLEALTETQRTIAVIKALGAVAPAIVSRDVYYGGAKHLVPILQLLIPGIDLNDPSKTLCTTAFLVEISQYIKIGDLSSFDEPVNGGSIDTEPTLPPDTGVSIPSFSMDDLDTPYTDVTPRLTKEEEDAMLKDSTGSFPDWVASFVRRVIQLLENLPEEGPDGSSGGATEVQVVDAVAGACSQICVHLSEPLYDMVLNMVYDYASTNVRSNAVRAIHQLVECVANADPVKTLDKFFPFCSMNIRTELENGASSLRTTSSSTPIPSDATLHWNLAILRGTVYNDGRSILKYKDEFLPLLHLLHDKTLSKRGYSWNGKLISSLLLTLTHVYPLENKFVNPNEWSSEEFKKYHHRHWGKLYAPDEVEICWHIPNDEEIDFSLQIFRELVEPTLLKLETLLMADSVRDAVWRNEFCRHLTLVRNAFAGIPTLFQHKSSPEEVHAAALTSDILGEIPEMIATIEPLASGFSLRNSEDPRYQYISNLHQRFGNFLHDASVALRQQGDQNTVDAVQILVYDGVRRRALPVLYKALEPGVDDDRMKGSLWTINLPSFGKYAISEPTLASKFIEMLFQCQHNEKACIDEPSIQDAVSAVVENFSWSHATLFMIFQYPRWPQLLPTSRPLHITPEDETLTQRCREGRILRVEDINGAVTITNAHVMSVAKSSRTHWRYAIYAVRCLRTLVRRDIPLTPEQIKFFLEKVHDDHPTIRYYAQRAVMKSIRNIKLRTFCDTPTDLVLARHRNPLKKDVSICPTRQLTSQFLNNFKIPVDLKSVQKEPIFFDKDPPGWLTWGKSVPLYKPPHLLKSTFQPWEPESADAIHAVRKLVIDPLYWEKIASYYSEENHETTITQDNVSCVKSIFQLLEDEPFEAFKPTAESMILDKDQNKQRAAAELLAGVLGGSKHWPASKQEKLWKWFKPHIKIIFSKNIKTDTLMIWTSFLEYMFYRRDPRRIQPLVDYLVEAFNHTDFNAELSFDAVKVLSLYRAFFEELGRKSVSWMDDAVERSWHEIRSEHEDVRAFIGEILAFTENIKWQTRPSLPTTEVFVRECQVLPHDYDIMGMRGTYHKARVLELVELFKVWREERAPGVRAFHSTYDRVGIAVCKWLYQSIHDTHAISTFDYILPLMPELFRFTEVNDNNELASRGSTLLVRMCGVTPPPSLVNPILDAIFDAIQNSPSWKVRLKALPLVQVFYFRQLPLIGEIKIVEMLEVLCRCLDDEIIEVREMAATTLSGILRLSPRRSILTLKDRFVRLLKNSTILGRQDSGYNKAIRQRHAAILGICALVDSYPYTVEKWMPELLTSVLAEHTYDPVPISTTVRKCASNFKRTHQDTWHEDSKRFTDDQLAALSTLLTGALDA